MEQIETIPKEIMDIIPRFDGDGKLLNLFVTKSEYVINAFRRVGNAAQDLYIFHAITGRLTGKAAHLISERQDINTWTELKTVFTQHFGDPRSEECIAIELENLKIRYGESYLDFCNRIQNVRSTLFSKINLITDEDVVDAKKTIYNHLALNVFLYNLPEDMIRVVRLHDCDNLESALSVVMEEVNFLTQYNNRNKNHQNSTTRSSQFQQQQMPNFRPNNNFFAQPKFGQTSQAFKFGMPQQQTHGFKFGVPHQSTSQGFRFGTPQQQNQRALMHNAQRPFMPNNNQFRPNVPNNFSQFKFGIPAAYQQAQGQRLPYQQWQPQGHSHNVSPRYDNDVSMRTAPQPRPNYVPQQRTANNLFFTNEEYNTEPDCPQQHFYMMDTVDQTDSQDQFCTYQEEEDFQQTQFSDETTETENFQLQASTTHPPK